MLKANRLGERLERIIEKRAIADYHVAIDCVVTVEGDDLPHLAYWNEQKLGVVPTQAEVDAESDQPIPPPDQSDSNNLGKREKAILRLIAQYHGKSGPEIRADYKAIWDSMP